jgi:hypothetical protein
LSWWISACTLLTRCAGQPTDARIVRSPRAFGFGGVDDVVDFHGSEPAAGSVGRWRARAASQQRAYASHGVAAEPELVEHVGAEPSRAVVVDVGDERCW